MNISKRMSWWYADSTRSHFAAARFVFRQNTFHYFTFRKIEMLRNPYDFTDDWTLKLTCVLNFYWKQIKHAFFALKTILLKMMNAIPWKKMKITDNLSNSTSHNRLRYLFLTLIVFRVSPISPPKNSGLPQAPPGWDSAGVRTYLKHYTCKRDWVLTFL